MKKRVLVVDDDFGFREALAQFLEAAGYEVLRASNGHQAVDEFYIRRVDIVLLDINMPRRNGWGTFDRLTAINPLLPVILITGYPGQYELAQQVGVGALFEKPLDFDRLLQTMEQLLGEPVEARLARLTRYDRHHVRLAADAATTFSDCG